MNSPPSAAKPFYDRTWVRVLVAALAVVLIVLIAVGVPRVRDCERYLSGFWVGERDFLDKAGLSEMYLYIAPREWSGGSWRRQGYLVIVGADGTLVSDQSVELEWSGRLGRWLSAVGGHFATDADEVYKIENARFVYDSDAVMPSDMHLGLNVTQGSVTLYTDEKLYAYLLKDPEVSAAANREYNRAEL